MFIVIFIKLIIYIENNDRIFSCMQNSKKIGLHWDLDTRALVTRASFRKK